MLKKYKAKSQVCLNVVLESGKSLHVSFKPVTGGSSAYYTENPAIQKALESHYKFGKLFKVDDNFAKEREQKAKNAAEQNTAAEKKEEKAGQLREVTVSCADDAKDYLSDKYGISRTKIRSIKAIQETAAQYGIVFKGI